PRGYHSLATLSPSPFFRARADPPRSPRYGMIRGTLVLYARRRPAEAGGSGARGGAMTHHVVLVGVDGSPTSLNAADWAAQYARVHGCSLHLVCSYSVPSFTAAALDGGYAALDDTAIADGARAVLDEAVQRLSGQGVAVDST